MLFLLTQLEIQYFSSKDIKKNDVQCHINVPNNELTMKTFLATERNFLSPNFDRVHGIVDSDRLQFDSSYFFSE